MDLPGDLDCELNLVVIEGLLCVTREDEVGAKSHTKTGSDCNPMQVQIHSSQAGGAEQVQCWQDLLHSILLYFKHEQHCLLVSSVVSEIQHLMDYTGQKRELSHTKSHLYPALILRSGHCTDI